MSVEAIDWLPDSAYREETIKSIFASLVDDWCRQWFVSNRGGLSLVTSSEGVASGGQRLRFKSGAGTIEFAPKGKRYLLEMFLGVDLSSQVLSESDRHVLDVVATDLLEDLAGRIDKEIAGKDLAGRDVSLWLNLSIAGKTLLTIAIARELLIPFIKKITGLQSTARKPLGSRTRALGPTVITAEAILGRIELAVSEIEELAIGDVLVLDRAISEPVDLRLSSSEQVIARGKLQRNNGQTSIQL